MTLKICVAQLNLIVGDLKGNADKIINSSIQAYRDGACLVLTPELSICGYAAEDLFFRTAFISACDDMVAYVAHALADFQNLSVVLGHPCRLPSGLPSDLFNVASVVSEGRVVASYAKRELPNYQVFDERRYFSPGKDVCVFKAGEPGDQLSVGLLICEDAWFCEPAAQTVRVGAQLLVVINASPFHLGKGLQREEMMRQRVLQTSVPLIYAHLVGGQDEVIFEGHSFALNADGAVSARAPSFVENRLYIQCNQAKGAIKLQSTIEAERDADHDLWDALVLGVRDYVGKNGFPGVLLGLSGGVDSALVLAIAVDALGCNRVRAVMMPSPYTADISWLDAREMALRLGVRYDEISIVPEFDAFKASLAKEFNGLVEDTTEENIQARIRGTLLMALSNKFGSIVLTTGNKSEMATGYCTLYGDMAGGFAVIKDLTKSIVFRLARWRNIHDLYRTGQSPIPERIIARPPSAELRPDQKDQDSLPPYDVLDAIVEMYIEQNQSIEEIVSSGFVRADVERVTRLIKTNEYKRRQSPVGIRVTPRSFGKDWRYPITNKFRA